MLFAANSRRRPRPGWTLQEIAQFAFAAPNTGCVRPRSILLSSDELKWTLMSTKGNVVSMDTIGDPHLAAVLLKKFLRDLPQPIFKEAIYPVIRRCPPPNDDPADISAVAYIRDTLLSQLDPCVYIVLSHYLRTFLFYIFP